MNLHADLSLPAMVDSDALPWVNSPMAGVERRMLERQGEEVARATSLVRYAPGSGFSAHTHGVGEEFLVLDGVFSDETGDFPAGWYVRNPPGSRHVPSSAPGAVILVKLRQMPDAETEPRRLDTADPGLWQDVAPGLRAATLFAAPWERVDLLRLAPCHAGGAETWPRGAEFFVVEGAVTLNGTKLGARGWARFPAGATVVLASEPGALVYRKTGHLG